MATEAQHKGDGLIGWFAQNHVAANMLMIFLIFGGLFAVSNMRTETFPSIDPRLITVTVPFPGATPFEVEDGITRRVEEAVMGIEGIKRVTSSAQENAGVVNIELLEFADADDALDDVETQIDQLADFPPEDAEEPVIVKVKPTPTVLSLVIYGDVEEKALKIWAQRIEQEMVRLPDTSLVSLSGDRDYQISIEVSEEALRRHNLSSTEVAGIVGAFSRDIPAGTLESKSGDILLRVQEKGKYGQSFENIVVRRDADGSLLRLSDIAEIRDGFKDVNIINKYNGHPAIFINVSRSEAQDTLRVENQVKDYLDGLDLPAGIRIDIWESETEILKDRINLLARNAVIGFALVFLILLLFLDLKLAFWTSWAIPVSFLGGLLIVYALGLSINMITLFALIVVLGIVVDDAIIAGESIFNQQERGFKDKEAAVRGVKRVIAPVSIGVLTTIVAFAPLLFVTGTLGQILRYIPFIVISILIISMIEAFLILPSHLSSSRRWNRTILSRIRNYFSAGLEYFAKNILNRAVKLALDFRYASLALFVGILIVALGMVQGGIVRFVFFPQIEGDEITVNLAMPVGTPFETTRDNAETILNGARSVGRAYGRDIYEGVHLAIGQSSSDEAMGRSSTQSRNHLAQLRIRLVEAGNRDVSTEEIVRRLRTEIGDIPGADELTFDSGLVGGGADINIELGHTETAKLRAAAERLKSAMAEIKGVVEVAETLKPGKREFVFELTPAGLAAGLTPETLGRQLRNAYFGFEVQRIQRARSELKVMVRAPEEERENLGSLMDLRIRLPQGDEMALGEAAAIREQTGFATIERADGQRVTNVTADTDVTKLTPNEATEIIFGDIIPSIEKDYPMLSVSLQGESRDRREDFQSLINNSVVALLIIYVLLGSVLRSYIQPLIIMAVIPFGIIGAVLGHLILGFNLSFISFFGITALTGVVINGSVVMIDYYNRLRAEGETLYEALIESVERRFRPILLTTLTTSMGLLPILTETSLQARFLIPMAISLAFGLIFGTLILLFLVPTLLAIVQDFKRLFRRLFPVHETSASH